jgi:glycosyltransferase involved in cell wall biosynthesis
MKVLHVVATANRRGGELFAAALMGALAHEGVEQRVAILREASGPAVEFGVPRVVVGDGRRPLPGIRMEAGAARNLARIVASFGPDVVQAHGGEPLKYALAATRGSGTRIVYRRIGDSAQFAGSELRRRAHARLMRRAIRVVAVADALREELIARYGLVPSRVVTIPNGVDVEQLEPSRSAQETRAALGIEPAAPVVLSLGALTWEKDPLGHLAVAAGVAASHPSLIHLIAGDGPLRAQAEAEARRLGVGDRTRFLGSRDDVPDLLAASDVLLLASRTEGMPACVIEAGIAGLPVAGYALAGVPEAVVSGDTGLLVPPGDRGALIDAVATLVGEAELRRRLGDAARERCRVLFDIRRVAPMYRDVYEAVASAA